MAVTPIFAAVLGTQLPSILSEVLNGGMPQPGDADAEDVGPTDAMLNSRMAGILSQAMVKSMLE